VTEQDPETPEHDTAEPAEHKLGGGLISDAHEHDRLPTTSSIPHAEASGVWGPRDDESSGLRPQVPPDPQPQPPGLFARLKAKLFG
jgi:hypothetical protein